MLPFLWCFFFVGGFPMAICVARSSGSRLRCECVIDLPRSLLFIYLFIYLCHLGFRLKAKYFHCGFPVILFILPELGCSTEWFVVIVTGRYFEVVGLLFKFPMGIWWRKILAKYWKPGIPNSPDFFRYFNNINFPHFKIGGNNEKTYYHKLQLAHAWLFLESVCISELRPLGYKYTYL